MPGFNQGGGTVRNINARLLFESIYKATGMRQAVTSGVSASRNAARSAVSVQQAMIRGTDAGILRLKNQMANINVAPNLSGARDRFVTQNAALIQGTRASYSQARAAQDSIGRQALAKQMLEGRSTSLQAQRESLMKEELLRMKTETHPMFKGLNISSTRENKYLALRQAAKYDPSLQGKQVEMWNRMRLESQKAGGYRPDKLSELGAQLGKSDNTALYQKIVGIKKQEEGVTKGIATVSQTISNLEKSRTESLNKAKNGQSALINSKKESVKLAKQEAAEEEKSQKNILKLRMAGMMAHKKEKQERIKDIQDAARIEQEALRTQSQLTSDIMSKWGGIVVVLQEIGNHLLHNLELTKQFRQAIILSGVNYSEDAFKQTAFGMDIGQMGSVYKAISRSAFPKDFQGKESMLAYFEDMFGVEAGAVVPMVGGMKSMFGKGVSIDKIMQQMMATSATSSFDFSGWSSIAMQGAVPALEDLGVGIEQVSALLAGISNMGGGPFAAGFGLSGLSQLAAPSKKQAGVLAQLGITKPSEFIRANGILNLLQKINDETAKLDASARDNAIKELFPSMTKGTSLMIMNNLDYFRKLEEMYKNPWNQASSMKKAELMPLNQVKEITALIKNIGAGFTEIIAGSAAAQLVFGTIKQTLKSIMLFITSMNKNQFFKQMIGLAVTVGTILTTFKLIKLLMVDIGMLAKSFKAFGILQSSSLLSAGRQEQLSVFLGKASPLLTTLGGIAAGIGAVLIAVNVIKAYSESKHQRDAIQQADNMKRLHELVMKRRKEGGLTPEEQREYYRLASPLLGNKLGSGTGAEQTIRFKVDVTGQTDPNANPALADEILSRFRKEIQDGLIKVRN